MADGTRPPLSLHGTSARNYMPREHAYLSATYYLLFTSDFD